MIYLEGNSNDNIVSNNEITIDKERNNDQTNKDTSNRDYTNNESNVVDKPVITTHSGELLIS